ncbi:MAG TPA: 3-hydroxybutyryl-CoA dehydrogenase [Gemmatimonadaceae bacterium]|jgi:3-hydroxybutyryl-CoA dehydrogenase|nr:3-hydroxybutyryl-CoA dehydrogenase [Gemmatimonadaceae bacterium]
MIDSVGVLGGGLMGSGIAEVAARAGFGTYVREVSSELADRARKSIEKSLGRAVERGKLSHEDCQAALARLAFGTDLQAAAVGKIVIEAVVEDLEVKNHLWRELNRLAKPETIFASNTSSLTIAAMSAASGRPDRLIGLHFFNPVPVMPLVEVIPTIGTSAATVEMADAFVRHLGKQPVRAKDASGFIVNRLLVPYMLDAVRAVEQGVGSTVDIDNAMRLGTGHPMGPLTLLDFVGIDTACRIAEIMFDEYRETRFAPPPLLRRMVLAGWFGRKSGRGFYDYTVDPPTPTAL